MFIFTGGQNCNLFVRSSLHPFPSPGLSLVAIPVYVKQSISFFESSSAGRLDLTVGPKQTMGKTVENLVITIHMPKAVLSTSLNATQGSYTYDPATKVVTNHHYCLTVPLWQYVECMLATHIV